MSRFCTGNLEIDADRITARLVTFDEEDVVSSFIGNAAPGDGFYIRANNETTLERTWCVYTVTAIISSTEFQFTPAFATGDPSFDSDKDALHRTVYAGQFDSEDNLSTDGRHCYNSEWYVTKDFTCFYGFPEIRKGDRAWADIYSMALKMIDDLLKNNTFNNITSWDYAGGYVKYPKG